MIDMCHVYWRRIPIGVAATAAALAWLTELPGHRGGDQPRSRLAAAATAGVAVTDAGLASGLLNTSRQIGGSLGLAVLATIATDRAHAVLAASQGSASVPAALNAGYSRAFLVAAGLSVAAALAAFIVPAIRGRANAR
jgi:hypothetical protein